MSLEEQFIVLAYTNYVNSYHCLTSSLKIVGETKYMYVFINRFSSIERTQNEELAAMDRISLLPHDLGVIQHL